MASPSTDTKTQIPVPPEQTNEASQSEAAEPAKPISSPSVFVNSEPIRPDQVENAVKFLSHPKVRGSPVMYRRSFLEKKGLTKEEIDEAFRQVPDPNPPAQASAVSQDVQPKTVPTAQAQVPAQAQQPAAAPAGTISRALSQPRFHWTHAIYAVGILAVSGAGTAVLFKKSVVPRLKSWIRKIVSEDETGVAPKTDLKPSMAEEAAAAAKAAADAAAQVAKASQELMTMNVEEKRYFRDLINMLDVQLQEMRAMSSSIRKLEEQTSNPGAVPTYHQDHNRVSGSKQPYANGKADYDSFSGRSSSPPAPAEPPAPPHPKSYMEIMAMVQRGERPPNVKDINDSPPNPHQQISNSRLAPKLKPWEAGQTTNSSSPYQATADSEQGNSDPTPWWQRKNVRITEVESEEDPRAGPYYSSRASEQAARSSWVPPQPPPIALAEAAEAIRRPKPTVQKEQQQPNDDQSAAQSLDELQRVTKIAETGGAESYPTNGMASQTSTSEIQEEIEQNY